MNKKAKITLLMSFAVFAASIYALAAAAAYQPRVVQPSPTVAAISSTDTAERDAPPESVPDETYRTKVIKLYRGKVAVFEEGADVPVKLLPTDVDQLPDNAVERLKEGVYAYTAEQYQTYIEDFS